MLIDVAISVYKNVVTKEAEKVRNYKDLTIDTEHMCNVKTEVISAITEAT